MALQYPKTFQIQEKFEKLSFRYGNQISEDSAISSCSTPSTPTSPIDFDIKIATLDDEQQVLEFLQKFFYKDEPLNAFMELITDEHPRCLDLEKFTLKDLDNGVNLLAIQNGKIIGVCLNGIIERDSNEDEFVSKDEKFSKIVKLLDYVAVESDPFQIYPGIDRAMVVKILSVDNSYRGKGIAKYLIAKTSMPYIDQNLRFSLDKTNVKLLRRRSEGRLRTYDSSEDLRSWNFTVDDRRRHILDIVRSDIEKCGQLSTAILHALCQRSKAELAKNLKKLWDFLMSRNLTPEEKEHLQQLQQQMGYVCMQAIKDCTCIGDYELLCVCDDETGFKHKNRLLNVIELLEQKLDRKQPLFEDNLPKEKKPCTCESNDPTISLNSAGKTVTDTTIGVVQDPNISLRSAGILKEPIDVVDSTKGAKISPRFAGIDESKSATDTTGVVQDTNIKLGTAGKVKELRYDTTGVVQDTNIKLGTAGKVQELRYVDNAITDDTLRINKSPDSYLDSKAKSTCHPSCIRFKQPRDVVEDAITDDTRRLNKPPDSYLGSKTKSTCHPSCIRFKANLNRPKSAEKNEVTTAEKAVRSVVSMTSIVCQCDIVPKKKATDSDVVNKKIGKNRPICQCVDKGTSTFPSPPGKSRSVKVGVVGDQVRQQGNDEFERELNALNGETVCPELEANIIEKELDTLKQYCMKLKEAETKRQEKSKLRATRLSEERKECEKCAVLTNKVKNLEDRLAKCTNTLPEDYEIYKNRSALIDTTLAERDEMQKKMQLVNETQNQLMEYQKKAARADELEEQLRKLQKEKLTNNEIRKFQTKCTCVERELENVRAERNAIQKRLDMMKEEMEILKGKAKEAEVLAVERDKLQIKLNDLAHVQVHNENLRLKCKCLEKSANERDAYKQRYETQLGMERENESLKAQLEEAAIIKRERDCLKRQVTDLQSCIVDQENEIKRLMQQIDNLIKNKDDIQSRMKDALESMRAEIEKKDELIASADKKLDKMQTELRTSIQGVSCEAECYKMRIEQLENELNEAKGQIAWLERTYMENQDGNRKTKDCQFAAVCSMKKELHAADMENKKLQEIANNMAILTGDEHVQKMLRQSEYAVRKVVEELSKQYREWDDLKKERRRPKSETCPRNCKKNLGNQ